MRDDAHELARLLPDPAQERLPADRHHRLREAFMEQINGPDDQALQAAAMGGFPFTYEVELVIDGVTHVATSTYPDDEIEDFAPSVQLHFTPPLAQSS